MQGLARIFQVSFMDVFIFTIISFEVKQRSTLGQLSIGIAIVLAVMYVCFILSLPIFWHFSWLKFTERQNNKDMSSEKTKA